MELTSLARGSLVDPALVRPGGRLRLRHLQCFMAVARLGRLRHAAQALAITQPAVTKTLNELEDILGVRLVVRERRGVTLTTHGQAFQPHAAACIEALDRALASVGQVSAAAAPLRIGALPTVAAAVLAPALREVRRSHPDSLAQVMTSNNAALLDALRRQELDVVVGRLSDPADMGGLNFEYLYAEPLAAVARPGHGLAGGRPLAVADLAGVALVLPPPGTLLRHAADGLLTAAGVTRPLVALQTLSVSLARALVASGDEVWLTAPGAVDGDIAAGLLVRLPLDTAGSEEPVGLLTRTDLAPGPAMRALLAALRAQAAARMRAAPVL